MKLFFILAVAMMSTAAFSQTCYVDMVQKNTNRVVRTFTAYGDANCMEGMKECRKSIRLDYSSNPQYPNGSLDCVADRRGTPTPTPTPNPYPNPNPNPYPNPPRNPYPSPADRFHVGGRVVYILDNTLGTVTRIDSYYNTLCVRFDRPRQDGAIERCDIPAERLNVSNIPNPTDYLRQGQRVVYTPDNTYGYVVSIDYYSSTVCMKFDRPRQDGAYERCNIPADYVRETSVQDPVTMLRPGQRVFYTPDNTLGYITSIDTYYSTVCIKFDRPRYDGAMERCNIQSSLVRPANY